MKREASEMRAWLAGVVERLNGRPERAIELLAAAQQQEDVAWCAGR